MIVWRSWKAGKYGTLVWGIVLIAVGNRWEPGWYHKWRNVRCHTSNITNTWSYTMYIEHHLKVGFPCCPDISVNSYFTDTIWAQCQCSIGPTRYFPDTDQLLRVLMTTRSRSKSDKDRQVENDIPSHSWPVTRLINHVLFHSTHKTAFSAHECGRVRGARTHGGPRQNGRRFHDDGWKFIFVSLDSTSTKICSQGSN